MGKQIATVLGVVLGVLLLLARTMGWGFSVGTWATITVVVALAAGAAGIFDSR